MTVPGELLRSWLDRQLPEAGREWLDLQCRRLADEASGQALDIALGMAPRKLGRADLELSGADLDDARAARGDWDPRGWSIDAAARVLFLLTAPAGNRSFAERLTHLCRTADVGEAIAYYRGLPVYPEPATLVPQACEGVRTNMRAVFEAVAHNNPFPRDYFDQNQWNQMVLKALFIESALDPIVGLDARANPELAQILCDYAHERWAAKRAVSPELWRCVGPFAEGAALEDLARAARSADPAERGAAALALSASPSDEARRLRDDLLGAEVAAVANGTLSWPGLAAAIRMESA